MPNSFASICDAPEGPPRLQNFPWDQLLSPFLTYQNSVSHSANPGSLLQRCYLKQVTNFFVLKLYFFICKIETMECLLCRFVLRFQLADLCKAFMRLLVYRKHFIFYYKFIKNYCRNILSKVSHTKSKYMNLFV